MAEAFQWFVIFFLALACLYNAARLDVVKAELFLMKMMPRDRPPAPGPSVEPMDPVFEVTLKKGKKHEMLYIPAATEALVIKELLARGIDPRSVVEIKHGILTRA